MASLVTEILALMFGFNLYIVPAIIGGVIVYMMKFWTCPLITRNGSELTLILGPDKSQVLKVTSRYMPFFTTKKGAYWFGQGKPVKVMQPKRAQKVDKPATSRGDLLSLFSFKKAPRQPKQAQKVDYDDKNFEAAPVPQNKLHIYVQAVNQPIDQLERMDSKLLDLRTHFEKEKQVKNQSVRFPRSSLAFERNWVLMIKDDSYELYPTRERQPVKINFFVRIGIYFATADAQKQAAAGENESAGDLKSLMVKTVAQKLGGDLDKNANFSAAFARKLLREIRWMEREFVNRLIGATNMLPILIMMGAAIAVVAVFFLYPGASGPGPRPLGP